MFSVPKFQKYKDHYKNFIASYKPYDEMYKWASLKTFQDNWDIESDDFLAMYDSSFQNNYTDNLWAGQFFLPKSTMKEIIKLDTSRVKEMFHELYDESKNIEKRIDRFVWHCDEFIPSLKEKFPKANNHYHSGNRMISIYLSFKYPEIYTIYKYTEFKTMMQRLGAMDIPGTSDIARFFKVMRTIYTLLIKDEELVKLIKDKTKEEKYFKDKTTLIAQDFYWCCTRDVYDIEKY